MGVKVPVWSYRPYRCFVVFILLALCYAPPAHGQLEWIEQIGTSRWDGANDVSADGLGNVYISGYTEGSLGGPNAGQEDAFLSKYNESGMLQWTRQFGTSQDDESNGVSADGLGNVYVTHITGGGYLAGGEVFISKYDASGALQWTEQIGTSGEERSFGVSADRAGYVYITGWTSGSLEGPNAGSYETRDAFLSKYDESGTLQWNQQLGTGGAEQASGVSADGLGNVYIAGGTRGSLGGPNAGSYDAFLSKYDESGILQWTQQFGTSEQEQGLGVSADGLGNVYITGETNGSVGGPNAGRSDAFVSKYDADGTLQWTRQLGTASRDESYGVSADRLGNVYISGRTYGSLGGANAGHGDAFISKFDASGILLWTQQFGREDYDGSSGVTADGLGDVYIAGATRNPDVLENDAFVAKFTDLSGPGADCDGDGDVDGDDVDAIIGDIINGTNDLAYDLATDGKVDKWDLSRWLSDAAAENGFDAPYLAGDANLDGTVDSTDLNNLALNWRQDVALWTAGDFTADGVVNSADLNALALNWRQSIPTAASSKASVPETSTMLLFVVGFPLICQFSRRK